MNFECPFCLTEISADINRCPECDYGIEFEATGDHEFSCGDGAISGIYRQYSEVYGQISDEDLSSPIYALEFQEQLAAETFRLMKPVEGLSIAEVGVGRGLLQHHILAGQPRQLLSLDIARSYAARARERYEQKKNSEIDYSIGVGNVEFMPYRNCFDLVVATDILEHVLNLGNALQRISRMLVAGGEFWCRVPFEETLGQYSTYKGQKSELGHLRFFDRRSLVDQLMEAGLSVRDVHYFGYQPGRFKFFVPRFLRWTLGKTLDVIGVFGADWHVFNKRARNPLFWPFHFIHKPTEILVRAVK